MARLYVKILYVTTRACNFERFHTVCMGRQNQGQENQVSICGVLPPCGAEKLLPDWVA
jgi:hypothetical protein